jgi:hypothetical protein
MIVDGTDAIGRAQVCSPPPSSPPRAPRSSALAARLGLYPIVTLEEQLPNMIGNLG